MSDQLSEIPEKPSATFAILEILDGLTLAEAGWTIENVQEELDGLKETALLETRVSKKAWTVPHA